jgi:hypothetical protein
MSNAKTTISGFITAAAGFVMFSPDLFAKWPIVLALAKYVTVGGFAVTGFLSKDFNSHSTAAQVTAATVEKQQETQAPGTSVLTVAQTSTQSTKPL